MNRLNGICLLFGGAFGFLFSAAGFNQYNVIHRMLLLQYRDPYLVMASAVAVAMPTLWFLERRKWRTPLGGPLSLTRWAFERKHVLGGVIFGAGWAVTGACPGTVTAMIGTGCVLGFVTLGGVLTGIVMRDAVAGQPLTASDEAVDETVKGPEPAPAAV